jgi:hypothetical protein
MKTSNKFIDWANRQANKSDIFATLFLLLTIVVSVIVAFSAIGSLMYVYECHVKETEEVKYHKFVINDELVGITATIDFYVPFQSRAKESVMIQQLVPTDSLEIGMCILKNKVEYQIIDWRINERERKRLELEREDELNAIREKHQRMIDEEKRRDAEFTKQIELICK